MESPERTPATASVAVTILIGSLVLVCGRNCGLSRHTVVQPRDSSSGPSVTPRGPFGPFAKSFQHCRTSIRGPMLHLEAMTLTVVLPVPGLLGRHPAVSIRRVDGADAPGLVAFYEALPADDRRRRFLGTARALGLPFCEQLCSNDHLHAEGFAAVSSSAGAADGRVVGHLCLVPDDSGAIEVGVAVGREWQGRGIGRLLFSAALDWAASHGIATLHATSFADNFRVLRLLTATPGSRIVQTDDPCLVNLEIHVPE